jgi:AcrR family transcriptional regulator
MVDRGPGSVAGGDRAGDDVAWRLPRGPHKLPRGVVVDHQRRRILAATAQAMAEYGYTAMNVEHILTIAGVSRATFYGNFDNKQECVLAAHEQAFSRLSSELAAACAGETEWPGKVAAAITAAIEFATRAPEEARLLVVEAMAADPALVSRVLASNDLLVGLLRNGRGQYPQAAGLPDLTERALIGAITSIVGTGLLSGCADRLPELEPQLVQLLLMPYVGIDRAREVAEGSP